MSGDVSLQDSIPLQYSAVQSQQDISTNKHISRAKLSRPANSSTGTHILEQTTPSRISIWQKIIRSPQRLLQLLKQDVKGSIDLPIVKEGERVHPQTPISPEELGAHFDYLNQIVNKRNGEEFQQYFAGLRQSGKHETAAQLAEKLLEDSLVKIKDSARNPDIQDPTADRLNANKIDQYRFVIKQLHRAYPEIGKFFIPFDVKKYKSTDFNENYLSPDGVRAIVSQLQADRSLPCDCEICDSVADFKSKLAEKLKSLESGPADAKCAFIVYNTDAKHFTPVFIEKTNQSYRVLVSDSIGREEKEINKYDPTHTIAAPINKALTEQFAKALPKNNFQIFSYMGEYRQRDVVSCPIFSIRDVVKLSTNPGLMDAVANSTGITGSTSKITYVDELPTELMKTTHGSKRIKAHTAKIAPQGTPEPLIKAGKEAKQLQSHQTVTDYMKDKTYTFFKADGSSPRVNMKAALTSLKYEKLVMTQVIVSTIRNARR